jgi:hypothetical protein
MSEYDLEVEPIATFSASDKTILSSVLESIGYLPIEPCGSDDSKSACKFRGGESSDLKEEADEVLATLIPQLHCLFTITVRSNDGRFETRWNRM